MSRFFWVLSAVLLTDAHAAIAGPSHPRTEVGVRCQQEYQNGWQVDVGDNDVWRRCSNFINRMASSNNVDFYFNLHGAKPVIETTNDGCGTGCGAIDAVDIFYMNTHSGVTATDVRWAMWDQGSRALSSAMRLGDNSRRAMVLASYSCTTMRSSDGGLVTRWQPIFSGGLVMALGGRELLYSGNAQSATEFASRMDDGEPVSQAWLEATWYADNDNTPTALASGRNADDCWGRMNGVTLSTLFPTPILKDQAIGSFCWRSWD
jgi:hypothetical protein